MHFHCTPAGVWFASMDDAQIESRIDELEQQEKRLRKDEEASAEAEGQGKTADGPGAIRAEVGA